MLYEICLRERNNIEKIDLMHWCQQPQCELYSQVILTIIHYKTIWKYNVGKEVLIYKLMPTTLLALVWS